MKRCYVCRRLAKTSRIQDRDACARCANAIPRVLELEAVESSLVRDVLRIRSETKDQHTLMLSENALRKASSAYVVDLGAITRVLSRIVAVLEPTAGKGHALETLKNDHQRSVGSTQMITYACIMPGCDVCAAVGAAQELLNQLTDAPSP